MAALLRNLLIMSIPRKRSPANIAIIPAVVIAVTFPSSFLLAEDDASISLITEPIVDIPRHIIISLRVEGEVMRSEAVYPAARWVLYVIVIILSKLYLVIANSNTIANYTGKYLNNQQKHQNKIKYKK